MSSRFEQRFRQFAVPRLQREFGVTITLTRGEDATEEFTARRNDREYTAIGADYGIEIKITMRDFILPVADLVIGEDEIEPRTGDRITEGTEVFEIQPPNENTPSVELQAGGFEWVVHTKKIE